MPRPQGQLCTRKAARRDEQSREGTATGAQSPRKSQRWASSEEGKARKVDHLTDLAFHHPDRPRALGAHASPTASGRRTRAGLQRGQLPTEPLPVPSDLWCQVLLACSLALFRGARARKGRTVVKGERRRVQGRGASTEPFFRD